MKKWQQHPSQHPLLNRQTTEVQDLLTLWGQEVVVNEKVIAESTVEYTDNRGVGLIDLVGTRGSSQWKGDSRIHCWIDRQKTGIISHNITHNITTYNITHTTSPHITSHTQHHPHIHTSSQPLHTTTLTPSHKYHHPHNHASGATFKLFQLVFF